MTQREELNGLLLNSAQTRIVEAVADAVQNIRAELQGGGVELYGDMTCQEVNHYPAEDGLPEWFALDLFYEEGSESFNVSFSMTRLAAAELHSLLGKALRGRKGKGAA